MPLRTTGSPLPPGGASTLSRTRIRILYEAWLSARARHHRWRPWLLVLLVAGLVLDVAVIWLGASLLFSEKPVSPPPDRKLAVPFQAARSLWSLYARWPVQEDGRIKPFDTLCRESVRTITGHEHFEGNDPVAIVVSWMMLFDEQRGRSDELGRTMKCDWDHYPLILCDFPPLRALLYQEQRADEDRLTEEELHGKSVEPSLLRSSQAFKTLVRQALIKRMEDGKAPLTPLEEKARDVSNRLELYEKICAGDACGLVALDQHGKTWFSLRALRDCAREPEQWTRLLTARRFDNPVAYEGQPLQPFPAAEVAEVLHGYTRLQQAYRTETSFAEASAAFRHILDRVSQSFQAGVDDHTLAAELWFNRTNPFRWAWIASVLTALLLAGHLTAARRLPLTGKILYGAGLACYVGALAWSVIGFWCRISISGRPPVGNMYESIIWVAFMTAVFGLLLELMYRRQAIALAAALVSALGLLLADLMPLTFSPSIQPLQAVLRSNYWLVIHVLTIVSSYAAFALAWGLGNINLGLMVMAPHRRDLVKVLAHFSYRAIQIGVVLLAAGTLLGGFWAAESWGRFWGWDPKEVWALIALLCYIIPLHARYAGWVQDFGLAICSVVCFASVVMAWYGVNFVLGAGLHSYGFGGGRDAWVYWAGLVNINLVVHAALRYVSCQRVPAVVRS